jgi:hypothetical protein
MLLAYLPAVIFEAFWEMLNEPARRADTRANMNLRKAAIPTAGKDSPSFITAGAVLAW